MELKSYAKVNLALGVNGLKDGFHDLDSVMATVDLYDTVMVTKRCDGLVTVTYDDGTTYPYDNALNTAERLKERYNLSGVDVFIKKGVPSGVGVGGSSVDSAGIVKAYEKLYGITVDDEEFLLELGADVPFLKEGGVAVVKGKGSVVRKLDLPTPFIMLVYGNERVNTKEAFALYDEIGGENGESKEFEKALRPFNALERAAVTLEPKILKSKNLLLECGFTSVTMTGSGAGFIGLEWDEVAFNEKALKVIEGATELKLTAKILKLVKE